MTKSSVTRYLRRLASERKIPKRNSARDASSCIQLNMAHEQKTHGSLPMPECFGMAFDAPENSQCRKCPVQALCMHRCAHIALMQAQSVCGSWTVEALAKQTGWRPDGVRRLLHLCRLTQTLPNQDVNRVVDPVIEKRGPTKAWPKRFLRERQRISALNYLPVGTKIRREYAGKEHVVEVEDGAYLYEGEHFPTLYSVAGKICGLKDYPRTKDNHQGRRTMSNFSVRKFFYRALEKALPKP